MGRGYLGRFAPSPTGPLHAGSLVAALASWLDARAHGGRWLVRIEDVDTPRCVPGAAEIILRQLADCGLVTGRDAGVAVAARRPVPAGPRPVGGRGACVSLRLLAQGHRDSLWRRRAARPSGTASSCIPAPAATAWPGARRAHGAFARRRGLVAWHDRRLGAQQQDVEREVGDFVLKRADGLWAYQLAVVVDDGEQGITQVVRGEDLADNTARQILLQRALGLPTPGYLHTPLVLGANGEKLSKQNGAQPLDTGDPLRVLNAAARMLGLAHQHGTPGQALAAWSAQWRDFYNLPGD